MSLKSTRNRFRLNRLRYLDCRWDRAARDRNRGSLDNPGGLYLELLCLTTTTTTTWRGMGRDNLMPMAAACHHRLLVGHCRFVTRIHETDLTISRICHAGTCQDRVRDTRHAQIASLCYFRLRVVDAAACMRQINVWFRRSDVNAILLVSLIVLRGSHVSRRLRLDDQRSVVDGRLWFDDIGYVLWRNRVSYSSWVLNNVKGVRCDGKDILCVRLRRNTDTHGRMLWWYVVLLFNKMLYCALLTENTCLLHFSILVFTSVHGRKFLLYLILTQNVILGNPRYILRHLWHRYLCIALDITI